MFPRLKLHKDPDDSFPQGAKDLGQGYVLLCACQKTASPVEEPEANAITRYWEENEWPNLDDLPWDIKQWAHLCLPNGQTVHSRWYECQSSCGLWKTMCTVSRNVFPFSLTAFYYYCVHDRWLLKEHLPSLESSISSGCNLVKLSILWCLFQYFRLSIRRFSRCRITLHKFATMVGQMLLLL